MSLRVCLCVCVCVCMGVYIYIYVCRYSHMKNPTHTHTRLVLLVHASRTCVSWRIPACVKSFTKLCGMTNPYMRFIHEREVLIPDYRHLRICNMAHRHLGHERRIAIEN